MSQSEIADITEYFGSAFNLQAKQETELISTGIPEIDRLAGGLPRGGITEIIGSASSGRTSLLHSLLKVSTAGGEMCALVDASDSFDPASAAVAGVRLDRLLWVRCGSHIERAMRATDILLHAGGFGLVTLDLADIPLHQSLRVQASAWFRFQRAIEHKPTSLFVISRAPNTRSCASLVLELKRESAEWLRSRPQELPVPACANLLDGFRLHVERCKPVCLDKREASFEAKASYQIMKAD